MAGDPNAGGGWLLTTVLGRIDRLSEDLRGEMTDLRTEMRTAHADLRRDFVEQGKAHAAEHGARKVEVDGRLGTLETFMRAREVRQARDDGALGVIRFLLETGGRNWQLVATLLTFLGLALGNVHLDLGVR